MDYKERLDYYINNMHIDDIKVTICHELCSETDKDKVAEIIDMFEKVVYNKYMKGVC
jgi:hypothetical protein